MNEKKLEEALIKINQLVNQPYDANSLLNEIRKISSRALYENMKNEIERKKS